ncbi:hypothetical protein WCD74_18285 [Actinomycetospora sp. OC33-EN08]|uniref:PD-(D/E)XK nuclease-like domain-containing protein n=1 Tax=Actinomycetospora aurantiaca TaxID=3129233 RepID=A0ABU8MR08_9PSEU
MVAARRYEELQARWRSEVLGLPAGPPTHPGSRRPTVGWCLPRAMGGVTAAEAGWNFLSAAARDYARRRKDGPGLVAEDRLWRNMLSSQPLAFNVVGELRTHPVAAASVLATLTGLEVVALVSLGDPDHDRFALDGLDAEWAPPKEFHTGDQSGFDIAALLRLGDGRRLLLSVEVKYTDYFSPGFRNDELARKVVQHRPHLAELDIDTHRGRELLHARTTSQFLRSVMITDSLVRRGIRGDDHLDGAIAAVLALDRDASAREGVSQVHAALGTSRVQPVFWSLEKFLDHAGAEPALAYWADTMRQRYLTGPIAVL